MTSDEPPAVRPRRAAFRALLAALPLLALGSFLAAISWRRWPDLLIDFGQQLYIPWRLAAGDRIGRDLLYFHGPLSQHLHAGLFRIFGASFSVLIGANLLVVAILTWLLVRIVRRASDRLTSIAAGAAFLGLFAFAQYVMVGNYNFLAPYTHEATHGVVFGAGMLLLLGRHLRRGGAGPAFGAGLFFGAALLTKVEAALAATAVAAAAFALGAAAFAFAAAGSPQAGGRAGRAGARGDGARAWGRGLGWFALGAAVLPLLSFAWFATYLPAAEAARSTAAGFLALGGGVTRFAFHRHVLGIDDLSGNLLALARSAASLGFALLTLFVVDRLAAPYVKRPGPAGCAAFAGFFAALAAFGDSVWIELPRALPLLALAVILFGGTRLLRDRAARSGSGAASAHAAAGSRREMHRRQMLLLLAVWGLALSLKGILNLHLYHYGFTLALPATMLAVTVFLFEAPRLFAARAGGGVFQWAALGMVAAALLFHVRWTVAIDALRTYDVGRGGDRMLTFGPAQAPAGPIVRQALDWLDRETVPAATLVTLPEGIMLNYLSRRPSTVPFTNFVTAEVVLFGQDRMVEALDRRPPDFVAFVARNTEELGIGRFGVIPGYGRRVVDWVEARYEPVAAFGDDPFREGSFGIRILKRRATPAGAPPGAAGPDAAGDAR